MEKTKLKLNEKTREVLLKTWADILWFIHFALVAFVIVLFFIPVSVWPSRIIVHFYTLWSIIFLQLLTGFAYITKTKKFQFVCPLTALEKHMVKQNPHQHVGESCITDFCAEKLGLPKWIGTISVLIALLLVSLQYFNII